MNMRPLIAGFVIALGIAEIANETALAGQTLDITPPSIRPDRDQRGGKSSVARPGLNEPHFISPLSVKTDAGQLGIAGWTSTNLNRPARPFPSGDGGGSPDSGSPPSGVLVRGARGA